MNGATEAGPGHSDPERRQRPLSRPQRKLWHRIGRLIATLLVVLALVFAVLAVLALSGKSIQLPVWAVAEIEDRLNAAIRSADLAGAPVSVSVGTVDLVVPDDWVPRLSLQDVKVRQADGSTLLSLPQARIEVDPGGLGQGQVRLKTITLTGAQLTVRRDAQGRFDLTSTVPPDAAFPSGSAPAPLTAGSLAALLDAVDLAADAPALSALTRVEIEGLSLTLSDARAGRTWQMGDGRLIIERRPDALAAELGVSLIQGGKAPALATFGVVTARTDASARLTVMVTGVAASDIAATVPPLAFLGVLDAPISGRLAARLDTKGALAGLEGQLDLGAGALRPEGNEAPLAFDRAGMALNFDPSTATVTLQQLSIQSRSVRMIATGQMLLRGSDGRVLPAGALPSQVLAQIRFADMQIDPEGLFEAPVTFSSGALDARVTLSPFSVEIGQLALQEADEHLLLSGRFVGDRAGWTAAIDVGLNRIGHDRLMKIWPLRLVPKTRTWLEQNLQAGDLFNVQGSLRAAPGTEPRFRMGYEFADVDVRFLRSLPPISKGFGRASIEGTHYVMAMDKGIVTAPQGGQITVNGSVFEVRDITQKPARADITLVTRASLAATLSILDQPPFQFATKAGQPVEIGRGTAHLTTRLSLPLVPRVTITEVSYAATGTIRDLTSGVIVPGRTLRAAALDVTVSRAGMQFSGAGTLDDVPFDVTYSQGFGVDARGTSRVEGTVILSDAGLRAFGIALPQGALQGQTTGTLTLDLKKGSPGQLRIVSDLDGMSVSIAALGYQKGAGTRGSLDTTARLGSTPEVTALSFEAPGMVAKGAITLKAGGGLDAARFSTLQVGDWLDAQAVLTGQGAGRAPDIALAGGKLDLRRMPARPDGDGQGEEGRAPMSLQLDQVIVSSGIALTDFRGTIADRGGMTGDFVAGVNGAGRVQGAIAPKKDGSAIRIRSDNAGRVLAAAGIFTAGRGGDLELVVKSQGAPGSYVGTAEIRKIRVVDAPVLAELLNAVSIIGLLEQLNGNGLLFTDVDVDFRMAGEVVEITRGAAVGASIGVSFAGLYDRDRSGLDLQGVVSPLYLVNGIGAIFTRRGEGLFGFNYRLRGQASDPQVSVNPLSILTPGMFREIFRRPPPVIKKDGG